MNSKQMTFIAAFWSQLQKADFIVLMELNSGKEDIVKASVA